MKKYIYIIPLEGVEAQKKGVIKATIHVSFTPDFIKKLIEITEGTIYFECSRSRDEIYLYSKDFGNELLSYVHDLIKESALNKIGEEPKEIYEITISENDFDFKGLAKKVAETKNTCLERKMLREKLKEILQTKQTIIKRASDDQILLVNDEVLKYDSKNVDDLKKIISHLENIDVNKILLELKTKELNKAQRYISDLEEKIIKLEEKIKEYEESEDEEDC
jgi:hypothetical protein